MARRRRGSSFRPKKVTDMIWIPSVSVGNTLTAGAQEEAAILVGANWSFSSQQEKGQLQTIRGMISISSGFEASDAFQWIGQIAIIHEDASIPTMTSSAAFVENVLWTGCWSGTHPTGNTTPVRTKEFDIHVKVKRNISNNQDIVFAQIMVNTVGASTHILRTLINRL